MTPTEHILRAFDEFQKGRVRYWAKPDEHQTLKTLHARLSALNRRYGYGWRFRKDRGAVMVSPPKGK